MAPAIKVEESEDAPRVQPPEIDMPTALARRRPRDDQEIENDDRPHKTPVHRKPV